MQWTSTSTLLWSRRYKMFFSICSSAFLANPCFSARKSCSPLFLARISYSLLFCNFFLPFKADIGGTFDCQELIFSQTYFKKVDIIQESRGKFYAQIEHLALKKKEHMHFSHYS